MHQCAKVWNNVSFSMCANSILRPILVCAYLPEDGFDEMVLIFTFIEDRQ